MPQNTYYCDFIGDASTCLESIYNCAFCNATKQCGTYDACTSLFKSGNATYNCTNVYTFGVDVCETPAPNWVSYLIACISFLVIFLTISFLLGYSILRYNKKVKDDESIGSELTSVEDKI